MGAPITECYIGIKRYKQCLNCFLSNLFLRESLRKIPVLTFLSLPKSTEIIERNAVNQTRKEDAL